jgi:hypothetical protein
MAIDLVPPAAVTVFQKYVLEFGCVSFMRGASVG